MVSAAQISREDTGTEEGRRAAIDAALRQLELRAWVAPATIVEPAERIANAAAEIGYDFAEQRAALLIWDARSRQGDFETALGEQRTIAAKAESSNQRAIVARANSNLAGTYFRLGMTVESQTAASAGVDWLDEDTMPSWHCEHLMVFAMHTSYFRSGAADFELFENALKLAREQDEPRLVLTVANNFAWLAHEVPEYGQRARELADEMEQLIDRDGAEAAAEELDTLAVIRTADREFAKAESLLERARNVSGAGEPDTDAALMTHLADLRRRQGRRIEARELLERGRNCAIRQKVPEYAIEALRMLAELDAEEHDYHRAYRRLRRFVAEQESLERSDAERRAAVLQSIYGTRSERERRRHYEVMASQDALTGLYNRRYFDEQLPRMLATGTLAVAIVDIDGFKSVNDENSHMVGDAVLRGISGLLASTVGMLDPGAFAARLGGDELAAVIPRDRRIEPVAAFDDLRRRVASAHFDQTPANLQVTISVGIATGNPSSDTYSLLLARADEALYRAKRGGRNQVVVAD